MNNLNTKFRIVADSAADVYSLKDVSFCAAPLKIITSQRKFTDDKTLNITEMVEHLKGYKGKSTSSCPNPDEWLKAFGDAEYIFAVAITSGLSGSYNAAVIAKQLYEERYPERRVFVIDSLSAGPEEKMLVEKLECLIKEGLGFEEICTEISRYSQSIDLAFMLQSLTNFANNGRVKPAVAKIVGLLGICIVGKASDQGTLEPMQKCKGIEKSLRAIISHLKSEGYCGGKVRIAHCFNEQDAMQLKRLILQDFPQADIEIYPTKGLCSFYAEKGGVLIGYEKAGA